MTAPDLDERHSLGDDDVRLCPPADGAGPWTALPRALRLADRPDGGPDLHLEIVRSAAVRLVQYAVVDARVDDTVDLGTAATLLAVRDPRAGVRPPAWSGGALVVAPLVGGAAERQPLGVGSGPVRVGVRLTPQQAASADALLADGALPVRVLAHRELPGVPRRLPVRVSFAPGELLDGLRDTVCTLPALGERIAAQWGRHRAGGTSAFRDVGGDPDAVSADEVGAALALRLRAAYGEFAVDLVTPDVPAVRLRPAGVGEPVVDHVDLDEPATVPCPIVLPLVADPALAGRLRGRDDLRGTTDVPALDTGLHAVTVLGNLPSDREGLFGVRLEKAATPGRPLPVDRSVVLRPPDDRASVLVRLAPAEPAELSARPFVYLDEHGTGAPVRLDGPARPHEGPSMLLGPGAFPVRLVPLAATASLLADAVLDVAVSWSDGPRTGTRTVTLSGSSPSRTLALPASVALGRVEVVARTPDGRVETVVLDAPPDAALDRLAFPYHGANALEVRCAFGPDREPRTVEFLPDHAGAEVVALGFSPERPTRTLRWFNPSIVRGSVRHRPFRATGPPAPWSAPHPPDRVLELPAVEPAHP